MHYQIMDIEIEPVRWDSKNRLRREQWGLPAQRIWFDEANRFSGIERRPLLLQIEAPTLERFPAVTR